IVHLLAAIFLFLFIYGTLNLPSVSDRYGSGSYLIALLASFMWAIHPIQTQAVTYIVQRMASMAGMFYVMGMFFYLKARTAAGKKKKAAFFAWCLLSFMLALGSKENTCLFPVSVLLYEILFFQGKGDRSLSRNVKLILLCTALTGLIIGVYLIHREGSLLSFLSGYKERPFTLYQRLLTEPRVVLFYVSQLLYPLPERLSVAHSFKLSTSLFHPVTTILSILLLLGATVMLLIKARRIPLIAFSCLFFLVNHGVESTVLPLELVFEHRNYIPSMMFFVPVAALFARGLDRFAEQRTMKAVMGASMILVLVGLGNMTYLRNFAWKNPESLWTDASLKAPGQWRVHHNLALYYQDRGDLRRAVEGFELALRSPVIHRKDEKILSYYQLGKLYGDMGRHGVSERFYQRALESDPDFYYALNSLASIYDRKGDFDRANEYLMKAYGANPADPSVNFDMGIFYLKENREDRAIYHLTKALLYLGVAYKKAGWYGRAVVTLKRSLHLDDRNITPRLHLMEIYAAKGLLPQGKEEARTVLKLLQREGPLLSQVMNLIVDKGSMGQIHLSSEIILPLLYEVCEEEGERLKEIGDTIKKHWKKN
ncbi:MAG: tetratricopeptide repeat protein, partial [Deltaproteobacteria bacterium]|nr:tetratricopeptide repeat protein [Deltaproteobacteria bacterium]